jgi:hypothetical protein
VRPGCAKEAGRTSGTPSPKQRRQGDSSRRNLRSASATGSADSFYHRQWQDHWWLDAETWASGGTYQNATYDDYNYQYRWTKTWQGQGDGAVSSSASNHVTGLENGSESGWWTHTVPEGSGSGTGSSSNTSWGSPWSHSYDETITYPGFYDYRYYGRDYGGGSGEEDHIAYVGDVFHESPGSDTGFFPFACSGEDPFFAQAEGGGHYAILVDAVANSTGEQEDLLPRASRRSATSPRAVALPNADRLATEQVFGADARVGHLSRDGTAEPIVTAAEESGSQQQGADSEDSSAWWWLNPWSYPGPRHIIKEPLHNSHVL